MNTHNIKLTTINDKERKFDLLPFGNTVHKMVKFFDTF